MERNQHLLATPTQATGEIANIYRVLIVDDNEASAKTLGWMMEGMGHEIELAYASKTALSKAKEFKPDIIMLDIGMPEMNGYELCRQMRRTPGLATAIYIAQTGWGQEQHLQRSKDAGFHFHMTKPISFEDLQKQLESIKIKSRV